MVRHQSRVFAMFAAMLLCGFPAPSVAQLTRPPNPDAPILVVVTFKSTADKKLGVDFAEVVRDKISGDVSYRDLQIVTKAVIDGTLQASGYDLTAALTEGDANLLAKQLRADEYIEGSINKDASGKLVASAWMVLTRDQTFVQPLGNFEGTKTGDIGSQISKAYQSAHKAYDDTKKCLSSRREDKYDDALSAAHSAISRYSRSSLARICEMAVMNDQKKPPAEVLKIAQEILQIDPKSKPALEAEVDAYDKLGDKDNKGKILVTLLSSDPTNSKLQQAVVYEYAQSGKYKEALDVISKTMADNPGDVTFVKLDWQLLYAMKNYKEMGPIGANMIQLDTSMADTTYFDRTIEAYRSDSNWTKAAETAALATKKYPNRADYWGQRGQMELKAGQVKQAVTSLKRALEIDPNTRGARLLIINSLIDAGEWDDAIASIRDALAHGEDANTLATMANVVGNRYFKTVNDTANKQKTIPNFQKVIGYVSYADSIAKDRSIKNGSIFLKGVSHYFIATLLIVDVQAQKSCDGAKQLQDVLVDASGELPVGGATNSDLVKQLMPIVGQLTDTAGQMVKVYCARPKKPPQF